MLDWGVARVILGTKAFQDPQWLRSASELFPERIVLGNAIAPHAAGYRRTGILLEILESDLTDTDKEAIFAGNAARVFGG